MKVFCNNSYERLRCCAIAIPKAGAFKHLTDPAGVLFREMPDWDKLRWELYNYAEFLIRFGVHVITFEYDRYPNQSFLRDLGVVVDYRLYLGTPAHSARWGEEHVLFHELVLPNGISCSQTYDTFEGADVLVEPKSLVIATGNRTSAQAAIRLMSSTNRQLCAVNALPEGVPQHLLGHKQIIASDFLLSRYELMEHTLGFSSVIRLPETVEIVEKFAFNICVLAPHVIVMPAGCPETKYLYELYGLTVYEVPITELHKMGGGLACATLPLVRDPLVRSYDH